MEERELNNLHRLETQYLDSSFILKGRSWGWKLDIEGERGTRAALGLLHNLYFLIYLSFHN